jgi:TolB-like protein/DNA-binding SARP family transcriptional activator
LNTSGISEPVAHLTLLGGIGIRRANQQEIPLPTRKARLLLAYLASPSDRMHQRGKLTGLLWGDRQEDQARGSLRNALSALRKILGADALTVEGDGVALPSNLVDVDVARFEGLVAERSLDSLREAVSIYAGAFLEGVATDQPTYQEWMLHEQLRIRTLTQTAFRSLADAELREQAFDPALEAASRLLELDPLDEQSHRTVMRVYAASGQRSMALRHYETCRQMLADELGVNPAAETEQLLLDVRNFDPRKFYEFAATVPPEISVSTGDAAGPLALTGDNMPAVAVLPFHDPSGTSNQDYFANGLTEDIITALKAWRSFNVIARNSSFSYKDIVVPIDQVAKELGARYVLEGSVRKGEGRLRITARLNDTVSGNQVWAEKFDRDMTDMFALQDELAQRIAAIVEPEIDQVERRRVASKMPTSLAAWE